MSLFDKYNINPHALDVTYGDDYFFLSEYLSAAFIYPPLKLSDSATKEGEINSTLDDTTAEFEADHTGNRIDSTLDDIIAEFKGGAASGDIYGSLENTSAEFLGSYATLDKRGMILPSVIFVTVYDYPNLNYTDNIDNVGEDYNSEEIFECYLAANIKFAEKISEQVIDTIPSVDKNGALIPHYKEDLYDKLIIIPSYIGLGNLLAVTHEIAEIWNTYTDEERIIDSIEKIDNEGIYIVAGSEDTPFSIPGFDSEVYTFEITLEGPPQIDAEYIWTAQNGYSVALNIVGTRVIAFPFPPDSGVEEVIKWLTDIIETYDGIEKRQCLRTIPRHTLNYEISLSDNREQNYAKVLLAGWHKRTFALPYWHEARMLTSLISVGQETISVNTKEAQYVDEGLLFIYESPFKNEVAEIESVEDDEIILNNDIKDSYNPGSFIMPTKSARLAPRFQHVDTKGMTKYDLEWNILETQDSQISSKTLDVSYKGYEVLIQPNLIDGDGVGREVDLESTFIDYKTGIVNRIDRFDFPKTHTNELVFDLNTREDVWEFRRWMYHLRGKNVSFALPTFKNDMTFAEEMSTGQTSFKIEWIGYSRYFMRQSVNHRYIVLFTKYFGSGINFRGSYDSDVTYNSGDAVVVSDPETGEDSIHVALKNGTGSHPLDDGKSSDDWGVAVYFRKIIGTSEIPEDDETEYIDLDAPLSMNVGEFYPSDFKMISYLNVVRLNSDRIEIAWDNTNKAKIVLPLKNLFFEEE